MFLGIEGILFAAPIADFIAMIVAASLTVSFFKSLDMDYDEKKRETVLMPSRQGIIITIAREHGSSGKQIGKLVARELGIPFYYKEMMVFAAQESGLDRKFISEFMIQRHTKPSVLWRFMGIVWERLKEISIVLMR